MTLPPKLLLAFATHTYTHALPKMPTNFEMKLSAYHSIARDIATLQAKFNMEWAIRLIDEVITSVEEIRLLLIHRMVNADEAETLELVRAEVHNALTDLICSKV